MASVAGGRITAGVGANLIGQHAQDRNQDATVYVGNLDVQVDASCSALCMDGIICWKNLVSADDSS